MKVTESLRNDFIASLNRLSNSIHKIIDEEYYDYFQISEIHRTYIEYCKALKSIELFSDIPVNLDIQLPKLFIKLNWVGKATIKDYFLFGKFIRRNYRFEKKAKAMLEDIKTNLQLIYVYLKNNNVIQNRNNSYVNELRG